MNRFENGQFAGATWGVIEGQIKRVHFIVNSEHPDGHLLIGSTAFLNKLVKTIYSPLQVPVKVKFVENSVKGDMPSLEDIRLSWEDFKPTEDYFPPLP